MCLVFGVGRVSAGCRPNRHETTRRNRQGVGRVSAGCQQGVGRVSVGCLLRVSPEGVGAPKSTGRRAEIDRIDRIATESTRRNRPNRPNRDRIGRPPPPFSVGRAVLDPRSLNFFALHCAFLQKYCKKSRAFSQFFCPPLRIFTKVLFFLPSTAQWRAKKSYFS